MKMSSLHYRELTREIKYHERDKYLMVDDYMVDKILERIKEITNIEEFDKTKILIDTNNKFPDDMLWYYCIVVICCDIIEILLKLWYY